MTADSDSLFQAAAQLPENERLALVSRLMETMPAEEIAVSVDDADLIAELERRFADADGAVSWSDLRSEG